MYKFVFVLCTIILYIKFIIYYCKKLYYNFFYIILQLNFLYIFCLGEDRWKGRCGAVEWVSAQHKDGGRISHDHVMDWNLLFVWNRPLGGLRPVDRKLDGPTEPWHSTTPPRSIKWQSPPPVFAFRPLGKQGFRPRSLSPGSPASQLRSRLQRRVRSFWAAFCSHGLAFHLVRALSVLDFICFGEDLS